MNSSPLFYLILAGAWLVLLIVYSIFFSPKENQKKIIFILIIVPIVLSSLYLAGETIYENIKSESKGPVHWHADYQVWACGERLDLVNPNFPKNKIGSPLLHEHDDDRIHIEGTIKNIEDISLGNYFKIIDGLLQPTSLIYRTDKERYSFENGDICKDTNTPGFLKVFVNGKKIEDPQSYLIYPSPKVPPGDCIIVEFSSTQSQTTDKICESWEVQGLNYENFQREEIKIGERTWQ